MLLVYKMTNTIDGMVYIGMTMRTLAERFKSHTYSAKQKPHYPLYAAMNEYGFDKFTIEPIEELSKFSPDSYAREQYWITYYDSAYPNGYNADASSLARLRGKSKFQDLTP